MHATVVSQSLDQFLTFFVADEEYAISVLKVTEIIECCALTKVPGAPSWIRGVINLRGAVVPVVDLAVKFGLAQTAITPRTCVVVVEVRSEDERIVLGVMADAVHQVFDIQPGDIQPSPAFGLKVRVDCILGMGSVNGKFVVILDIDHILSTNDVLVASAVIDPEATLPMAIEADQS
jgi:purine-binding chemotaxis protein CheW